MGILFWLAIALLAWLIVGALMMALINDEKGSYLTWAKSFPILDLGVLIVLLLWPVVVFFHIYYNR